MKCPKCGYLGFEPVNRCRNCGYDFSLSSPAGDLDPDLPIRTEASRVELPADLSLDANDRSPVSSAERSQDLKHAVSWAPGDPDERARDAAVSARFVAVVIDLLILTAIDATVIYFTLQICGVTVDELGIVPKVPLVAFLLVQNGGYLIAFTMGGQTLGKMAVDIRVVPADSSDKLDVARACVRTAVWVLLA